MGRNIPSESIASTHPSLALPLLALWIVAAVSILTSLCVSLFRRPKQEPPFKPSPSITIDRSTENADDIVAGNANDTMLEQLPPVITTITANTIEAIDMECQEETPPPLPPPLPTPPMYVVTQGPIPLIKKSHSRRSHSLRIPEGLKLHEGLSKIKTCRRDRHEKTVMGEDSLWKKTIILGEKCRVESDDDEDVPVFDEKGNRQKNYHKRTMSLVPPSRSSSFANNDSQPSWEYRIFHPLLLLLEIKDISMYIKHSFVTLSAMFCFM